MFSCSKSEQKQLNTWVSFQSAEEPLLGQFSVSGNTSGLLRDTGRVLLDAEMDVPVIAEIREVIEARPIRATITDLHVWRVGKGKYACILSLAVMDAAEPDYIRQQLSIHEELVHITVEVNQRRWQVSA